MALKHICIALCPQNVKFRKQYFILNMLSNFKSVIRRIENYNGYNWSVSYKDKIRIIQDLHFSKKSIIVSGFNLSGLIPGANADGM